MTTSLYKICDQIQITIKDGFGLKKSQDINPEWQGAER